MMQQNEMKLEFDSRSCNESFARVAVAAFMTQLNPTLEEVADVKTAVSEAVTNAIIHGYEGQVEKITILCRIEGEVLEVEVSDHGRGIADVALAMQPLYTTKTECDRAGMGFAFMEAFMDTLDVQSQVGEGTCVKMSKRIPREERFYGKDSTEETECEWPGKKQAAALSPEKSDRKIEER
jgi:stage II sporulation protein AB (anti-sigma F factor)